MPALIRLQPQQISQYWEHLKYAACLADKVPPDQRPVYCKKLLLDLMTNKSQAWFGMSDAKEVKVSAITQIRENEESGVRELFICWLFGYTAMEEEESKKFFFDCVTFAKNSECCRVIAHSNVKRIWELCELVGAVQPYRVYTFNT